MNKSELTKQVAEELNIPHTESLRYFKTLQNVITKELEQEGVITLQGFGTFFPWYQSERPGRNPQNGIPCTIRRRLSVKFKPGKILLKVMNEKNDK